MLTTFKLGETPGGALRDRVWGTQLQQSDLGEEREQRGERTNMVIGDMVNSDTWPEWGSGDSASDPCQDCEQMDSQTWSSVRTVSVIASN